MTLLKVNEFIVKLVKKKIDTNMTLFSLINTNNTIYKLK